MRKTMISAKSIRVVLACMLLALLPALNSCKQESADVSDLLSTVPSSASAVVGVNLTAVLEKSGCKVSGADITPGKDVEAWINGQKEYVGNEKEALRLFLSGDSGIDPMGAVMFVDAYNTYGTAMLADTNKFKSFVETQTGKKFASSGNDVETCGNVAVCGAQMWVNLTSNYDIDPKAVKNYASLESGQTFMANAVSPQFSTMTHDVVGYGRIKDFVKAMGLSFGDQSSVNLITGMLFDNATSLSFNLDFLKGELKSQLTILNDKGEPAKYLLPAEKIDLDDVKATGTTANCVLAFTITKDLTKKLEKIGSSLGGNMLGSLTGSLKSIDGTVAVAMGNLEDSDSSISGVVATDGNPSLDLMSMLSQFGATQRDGKLVKFSKGTVSGDLEVAKVSEMMKGAAFAAAMDQSAMPAGKLKNLKWLHTLAISFNPDKGGMRVDMNVKGADDSENILISILKDSTVK